MNIESSHPMRDLTIQMASGLAEISSGGRFCNRMDHGRSPYFRSSTGGKGAQSFDFEKGRNLYRNLSETIPAELAVM